MATKEQVAEFFKFEETDEPMAVDDQYVLIGREEDYAIQVMEPVNYDGEKTQYALTVYHDEGAIFHAKDAGFYDDLETAQRKCLELAGIDPDVDAVPQPSAPGPK